jgi:CRISPR/Cas system-associated exonuclease Cas4 (RecB family)
MIVQSKTIKTAIEEAQNKYLQEQIHRSRWNSIRASGIGDVCNRRIYYYLQCGELADEITPELAAIFGEGADQEADVRRFLSTLGFEVMKAGFTEQWREFNISGSVDGTLEHNGKRYIVEIKTVSEFAWEKLQTAQDFNEGFYQKWYAQIQLYMLLFNHDKGVFILKRKQAKQLRIIEIDLDYSYAESLLKKAEIVNKAVKENTPPEFIKNPIECKKCPFFGKVCNPSLDFGDAIVQIEDEVISEKLRIREELKPVASQYEKIDKEIKERFKEIPDAICGDFHISGKSSVIKYKPQEAREVTVWKAKIERIN